MGFLEHRGIFMYKVRRHPPESRGAHFESKVGELGHVDPGAGGVAATDGQLAGASRV
jgi:hypothetical protein